MYPSELEWLEETARRYQSAAEIGCWKGRSTFALLSGCRGEVFAVDHWLGSAAERAYGHREAVAGDVFAQFLLNVGHFANLRFLRMDSLEAARQVAADMVFIDGGHQYGEVVADIRAWRPRARMLMSGHDYGPAWPEVVRAVNDELGTVERGPGSIWFKDVGV